MTNYVYIATSLDGFIATIDGGLDWLEEIPNPEQSDYGYAEFMKSIDAIVMGRNTFDKVLSFGKWVYHKPVFVLSNSLTKLPEKKIGKAEIVRGDIKTIINQLHQKGYTNLYIDGGRVIQSFLQEDLVDEMIITRVPILLGKGVPLFGTLEQYLKFRHKKTEIYNDILVKSYYIRDKNVEV
ncbi:MAG: dihydrofolate reductase [Moorea sp. SIO2B7]|uniref:Dihydrofolate reductase family protein n=1 Tax=Moorena producens (strain JHB) TaxID=1454205 RepID=A0A1D9G2F0_MOOP1|nr:dihydrofolate reductase family protein [Moorena producens]AOY81797.1 dihydrofolate reductase family protein [Moorena producens JHB]NES84184.1 dihydrofolate reductase [Moorena sp. SIO2B7]